MTTTVASDYHDDSDKGRSLSVVAGNGLAASTSSIAPQQASPNNASKASNEQRLDFIGSSTAVKKLFSMSLDALSPSSSSSTIQQQQKEEDQQPNKKQTLLAIHNFDGTLIIDDAEDESNYEFFQSNSHHHHQEEENSNYEFYNTSSSNKNDERISNSLASATGLLPPSSQSLALALSPVDNPPDTVSMLSSIVNQQSNSANESSSSSSDHQEHSSALLAPPKAPREYVQWQFQDLNMLLGHDALVVRPPEGPSESGSGFAVRVEDVCFLKSVWEAFQKQQLQQKQTPLLENDNVRSYAQALLREREAESPTTKMHNPTSAVVPIPNTNNNSQGDIKNPNISTKKEQSSESEVPLQTCIVPFLGPLGSKISSPLGNSSPAPLSNESTHSPPVSIGPSSPALSIVLDAYLDNLMANVPQLALCLEEKGLIQSVKMLPTEEIPSMMLNPSTLDTSRPLDIHSSVEGKPTNSKARSRHRRQLSSSKLEESIFSPQIMETNASALLRFLKTNCTRNHATYLLRHEAVSGNKAANESNSNSNSNSNVSPHHNIQLYDISSISTQKQKKWIWWLATMSYRFALRLRHLETEPGKILSEAQKRAIRDRQRSLFQQTLDLLQDLMDIDGKAHESMVASVREHMADTYLNSSSSNNSNNQNNGEIRDVDLSSEINSPRKKHPLSEMSPFPPVVSATISTNNNSVTPPSSPLASAIPSQQLPNFENTPPLNNSPGTTTSANQESHHQQPYAAVPVDALNKAQDHLVQGIKTLSSLFERDMEKRRIHRETKKLREVAALKRSRRRQRSQRSVDSNHQLQEEKIDDDERIPMAMQLFGMGFKHVNISLRLAEHHLGNYYSSSAMQALRTAARRLNDAARLLDFCNCNKNSNRESIENEERRTTKRYESLQIQYIWLLEHCGHFARCFASDELWRDRGHASGEDVISVLADVESVFEDSFQEIGAEKSKSRFWKMVKLDFLLKKSKGKISLQSLSGIVAPFETKADQVETAIEFAKAVLGKENILRRERRKVLVASCILYSRAITAFQFTVQLWDRQSPEKMVLLNLLRQRLGDACNETGKVLLAALRILLVNNQGNKNTDESQLAAEALLDSAEFWFTVGLEAFEACRDIRNLALLRCNLCQSFKLRANSGFSKRGKTSSPKHAEECLQQAADQLLTAHEDLGVRDTDPHTWDMVSEELAATYLVLGVRHRQSLLGSGNAPVIFQVMRLSPGEERSIVDPMERALKIYEQSDNAHQAAAVHYQLALTFSKLWTCQLNEANTRKKLSKAFGHYSSAFNYFSTHSRGNEPTFCLLCLDLASLYAAIPGEEGLMKSLGCCLDCCDTFSMETITTSTSITCSTAKSKAEWYEKMETISQSVDDRVFRLLRSLVKADPVRYKDMYRAGLTAKMVRNVPSDEHEENPKSAALLALHEVLLAVKKTYGIIVSK